MASTGAADDAIQQKISALKEEHDKLFAQEEEISTKRYALLDEMSRLEEEKAALATGLTQEEEEDLRSLLKTLGPIITAEFVMSGSLKIVKEKPDIKCPFSIDYKFALEFEPMCNSYHPSFTVEVKSELEQVAVLVREYFEQVEAHYRDEEEGITKFNRCYWYIDWDNYHKYKFIKSDSKKPSILCKK